MAQVVTICGSTRFEDGIKKLRKILTLQGYVVLGPEIYLHGSDSTIPYDEAVKEMLDKLHLSKIDLSHEVYVVTNDERYIGESTRREIDYATSIYRPIHYWSVDRNGEIKNV